MLNEKLRFLNNDKSHFPNELERRGQHPGDTKGQEYIPKGHPPLETCQRRAPAGNCGINGEREQFFHWICPGVGVGNTSRSAAGCKRAKEEDGPETLANRQNGTGNGILGEGYKSRWRNVHRKHVQSYLRQDLY